MKDNLHTGQEARDKLIAGIRKCSSAVGITMGTGGSNCLLEAMENPGHYSTNDGATILESIRLADPIEDMGRRILLEAVKRANKQSGDGSSTCCVLTAAIIEEGLKHTEASPMDIKRSLEACIPLIETSVNAQKREITVDEVGAVCAISAESEEIGALIQEIYQKIGKDGLIYWDVSKTVEDSYTIGNGITIDGAGYLSPYMCDVDEKTGQFLKVATLKKPKVLITKQKITNGAEFSDLFSALYTQEIKEVVVFCDEIEAGAIPNLIKTRIERGFKALIVKMPVIWKDQWYEDLALASGATIIDPAMGTTYKTMTVDSLGTFDHITVSKDETFIDGIKDISAHIESLKGQNEDEANNRAARLNTKTARLYVGAHSESALAYRRLKIEDSIAAGHGALNHGIVVGGGKALLNAGRDLPDTIGGNILRIALQAPLRQIVKNAGADVESVIRDL